MMEVGVLTALDVDSLAVYAALLDRVTSGIEQVNGALMSQLRNLANDLGMTLRPGSGYGLINHRNPK